MTNDISDGATLRDRGVAQVDANTSDDWKTQADAAIDRLAASGEAFTAEDVRAIAGDPPNHPSAMGTRFLSATRRGVIERVGFAHAKRPAAHKRMLAVYKGASQAPEAAA